MAEKMTLDEVSDALRNNADGLVRMDEHPILANRLRKLADAIDAHITQPAQAVAWLVQKKTTGELELAEPNEKASNPRYWSDAFPVYGSPSSVTPEMVHEMDVGAIREVIANIRRCAGNNNPVTHERWADALTRALGNAQAEGWRPIETAPKDGTVVLLAIERPGYSGMTLAYQRDGQWFKEETGAAFGGWTHWQPLPAPLQPKRVP